MSRSAAIRESLDRRRQEIKRGGTPGDDFGCDVLTRGSHERSSYNFRERRAYAQANRPPLDNYVDNSFAFGQSDYPGSSPYNTETPGLNPGLTSYLQSRGLATTFLNGDKGLSSYSSTDTPSYSSTDRTQSPSYSRSDRPLSPSYIPSDRTRSPNYSRSDRIVSPTYSRSERSPAPSYVTRPMTGSLGIGPGPPGSSFGLTGSYVDRGGPTSGYRSSLLSSSYLTDTGRNESAFERYRRKSIEENGEDTPNQEEPVTQDDENDTWHTYEEVVEPENQNGTEEVEEANIRNQVENGDHDQTLSYTDRARAMRYIGTTNYGDKQQQQQQQQLQQQQQQQQHQQQLQHNNYSNNNGFTTDTDDVVYYSLFDNYIIVHLETVAPADQDVLPGSQSLSSSAQKAKKSSSVASRNHASLSAGASSLPGFGSGPWLKEIHVPEHKKRSLITNLDGLILELQQKVARLRDDADEQDVVTSQQRNKSDQSKIEDNPTIDGVDEIKPCGSVTCHHAEELRALQKKQKNERVATDEQIIHRTDAEKCASKLESDNRQLTYLLKQAQDQLTEYQNKPSADVKGAPNNKDLLQRIKEARDTVELLPQQCEELKQDCYNLQWLMTDEINKIKELVQSPNQFGSLSTSKTAQSGEEPVTTTSPASSESKPLPVRSLSTDKRPPPPISTKPPRSSKNLELTKSSSTFPLRSVANESARVRPPPLKPKPVTKTKVLMKLVRRDSSTDSEGQQESIASGDGLGDSDREDDIVSTEISAILAAISRLNAEAVDSSDDILGGDDSNSLCSDVPRDEKDGQNLYINKIYDNEIIPESKNNIDVICRLRPLIKDDGDSPPADLQLDPSNDCVINAMYRSRLKTYEVNHILDSTASQEQILEESKSTVLACLTGFNVTFFAYGHTGSGKSYTLQGTSQNPGIVRRVVDCLLESLNVDPEEWDCSVTVGVTELYNDIFRDLLDLTSKLEVKQYPDGSIGLPGLRHEQVLVTADVDQVLAQAQTNRGKGIGKSPEHSARSHLLTIVTVSRLHRTDASKTVTNKVNFVDLAGSERVDKAAVDAARYKEAQNIGKTLTCIGDVIYARRSRGTHVPIRSSRLTHLLQDSLMGSSHILLMVMLSSAERHISETIASLMFAQRVSAGEQGTSFTSSRRGSRQECNVSMESLASRQSNGMKLRSVEIDITGRRSSLDSGTPPASNSRRTSGKATPEQREPSSNRSMDRSRSTRALSEGVVLVKPVKPHYADSRPEAYKKTQVEDNSTSRPYPKSPHRR